MLTGEFSGDTGMKRAGEYGYMGMEQQIISWPEVGAATHVGRVRQQNEDSYLVSTALRPVGRG